MRRMTMQARIGVALTAIAVPMIFTLHASAQGVTGLGFENGQTLASAGSIPPSSSVNFTLRVTSNGVLDPGGTVFVSYTTNAPGDSTTAPAAQCGGQTAVTSHPLQCTADSKGHLVLTYHTPADPPAQAHADFTATNASSHASASAVTHYVYTSVFRFLPSPVAPSGSLTAGQSVTLTLTGEDGLDQGVPGLPMYLSFAQAPGGGSASVGGTALTSTPTLFTADSSGALQVVYTAPSTLPSSGIDSIKVQDLPSNPTGVASDSYDFVAGSPVISIGNSSVNQAHSQPGVPGRFTVTISPVQSSAVTVNYVTICGIGDKWCSEDFKQVTTPETVTIAAGKTSTTISVRQFSYTGENGGEDFNEGWFVELESPSVGVLGRAVGEGVLLPDTESDSQPPLLYVGDTGVMPVNDKGGVPVFFVVTMGATENSDVTFSYATADGSATAGVNYTAASGTATIAAGATSTYIKVTILPGSPPSSNLTFTLTISNDSAGLTIQRPTGTGTVLAS